MSSGCLLIDYSGFWIWYMSDLVWFMRLQNFDCECSSHRRTAWIFHLRIRTGNWLILWIFSRRRFWSRNVTQRYRLPTLHFADKHICNGTQQLSAFHASSCRQYQLTNICMCKAHIRRHLSLEARGCTYLVLWLDCDREGENICYEGKPCSLFWMRYWRCIMLLDVEVIERIVELKLISSTL